MNSDFIHAVFQASIEILGKDEAKTVFAKQGLRMPLRKGSMDFSLDDFGSDLALVYDMQSAMGLLIRIGRAALTFIRRAFKDIELLGGIENRLKPIIRRFPDSLQKMALVLSQVIDAKMQVEASDMQGYDWLIRLSEKQSRDQRIWAAYFFFGLLEEFCTWLDARKEYRLALAVHDAESQWTRIHIQILEKD